MSAAAIFSGRNSLHTMRADLRFQQCPDAGSFEGTNQMSVDGGKQHDLDAIADGVSGQCRKEIVGEQFGIVTAFATFDFDNDFARITQGLAKASLKRWLRLRRWKLMISLAWIFV